MGKKTKTTSKPWSAAQPYLLGGAQSLQDTYNQNQPALQANAGRINEALPGLASRAFGNNPLVQAGQGYATDVLGGKYLSGNPFLQSMIQQTGDSVSDRVNSLFGQAGRTGGTQHVDSLVSELADAENRLRYTDYGSERDRMTQAAGLTPSLVQSEYAGIMPFLSASQVGSEIPYIGSQNLASGYGSLFSGTGTQTQKKPFGQSLLDLAAAGAMTAGGLGWKPLA